MHKKHQRQPGVGFAPQELEQTGELLRPHLMIRVEALSAAPPQNARRRLDGRQGAENRWQWALIRTPGGLCHFSDDRPAKHGEGVNARRHALPLRQRRDGAQGRRREVGHALPEIQGQQYLGFLVTHIGPPARKVITPVHAQERRQGVRANPQLLHRPPAEQCCGIAHRAHGMARIELAVAECPLAVLPGLAPHHGGQADRQCRPGGKGMPMAGAQFQGMPIGQVMVKTVGQPRHARNQHIGLHGVEVAAGRIGPHGPAVGPEGFPGGETEGEMQERPQRSQIRHRRAERWRCEGFRVGKGQGKCWCARKMPERLRASVPIEGRRAGGIGGEMMLGPLLIDLDHLPGGKGGRGRFSGHQGRRGHGRDEGGFDIGQQEQCPPGANDLTPAARYAADLSDTAPILTPRTKRCLCRLPDIFYVKCA